MSRDYRYSTSLVCLALSLAVVTALGTFIRPAFAEIPTANQISTTALHQLAGFKGDDPLVRRVEGEHEFHPSRVIVRFKPNTRLAVKQAAHLTAGTVKTLRNYRYVSDSHLVEVPAGEVLEAVKAYKVDPNVLYAEPDYVIHALEIPNDPYFDLLWGLHNTGQRLRSDPGTPGADIRAVLAWDLWRGDPNFRIAVLDSGVDYTHPDLVANIWTNEAELYGVRGVDDDGNGYIDDIHGYDFVNDDGDPMDDFFHGTHVSGTIGAFGNNFEGVVGVNWQCKIVALKVLNASGGGYFADIIASIEYVIANNIKVSNASWSGYMYSQELYEVIAASQMVDHILVASAGNFSSNNDIYPQYPASFDLPNIIAVAATDKHDDLASFSNYGPMSVDIGAPGAGIYGTMLGAEYAFRSGTSMAAPHVTGVVALLISRLPNLNWEEVKFRILQTVRPIESLANLTVTGGVVNAVAAVGDCNNNGIFDEQDIAVGTSDDCTGDGIPDECETWPDCNENGSADFNDACNGSSQDLNTNGVPDECEAPLCILVDDNGPDDPGPGDPTVSDPDEDGSEDHPYDAIQEAIDAARDIEDENPEESFLVEIVVVDGTYAGPGNRDLDLYGRPYGLHSRQGPGTCTIDCQGSYEDPRRGFYFHSYETSGTRVDGFTIVNGFADQGGAIYLGNNVQATIQNCVITGNVADTGGGIYAYSSYPTISNCIITANTAIGDGGGLFYGSGPVISSPPPPNPQIRNCMITGNRAERGGGLASGGSGDQTWHIHNCTITGNRADSSGGGIYCNGSRPDLQNCILWYDTAPAGREIAISPPLFGTVELLKKSTGHRY